MEYDRTPVKSSVDGLYDPFLIPIHLKIYKNVLGFKKIGLKMSTYSLS